MYDMSGSVGRRTVRRRLDVRMALVAAIVAGASLTSGWWHTQPVEAATSHASAGGPASTTHVPGVRSIDPIDLP
jgi:hypothetical protein